MTITEKLEFLYNQYLYCYVYLHQQKDQTLSFETIFLGAAFTREDVENIYKAITHTELS